jgi:hypothetical protein
MAYAGEPLTNALGRELTESEADELMMAYQGLLETLLKEFEFNDPEDVPRIDPIEEWCEENKGKGFKRPYGHVIYTLTGSVAPFKHGIVFRNVPEVQRSSDGKKVPMPKSQLNEMREA